MRFKKIIKLFDSGNVCVTGLRGTGKDVLFGNVIARRNVDYVSNLDYGYKYNKLELNNLDCGKNTFENFISGNVNYYKYPYPLGSDVYISDVGVYFPAQATLKLNAKYDYFSVYEALSRQVSRNNVHINVQNLNRAWDKIREQSDIYIRCRKCFVIFGFVIQFITIYDKYQSCVDRVAPCRVTVPFFNKEAQLSAKIYIDDFVNRHGSVKNHILIYRNKSTHDTYYFEKLLLGGKKNEEKK